MARGKELREGFEREEKLAQVERERDDLKKRNENIVSATWAERLAFEQERDQARADCREAARTLEDAQSVLYNAHVELPGQPEQPDLVLGAIDEALRALASYTQDEKEEQ